MPSHPPDSCESANPTLLVFADDWGRHPSSCQHLIRRLLPRYPATWVNTIGMRPPRLDLVTLRRAMEKLGHWTAPRREPNPLPENLSVVKPLMWPWFRRRFDRALNRRFLASQLNRRLRSARSPVTAVTTLPIVADLMGSLDVSRWVYYCVDDFSHWPGLDQKTMEAMEREVIDRADVLVAASECLQQRLLSFRPNVELMTHGVDLEHWAPGSNGEVLSSSLHELEAPFVTYWGLVDRRMDGEFLRSLAEEMTRGTILLAGPEQNPDPALANLPRVRRLPPLPYDDLPQLAAHSAVLVMPYADSAVTRAMQPLKLPEYLATGKPVVVRDLPSTQAWRGCLDLARTADEFASAVLQRLERGLPAEQRLARRRLHDESWDAKAAFFERVALRPQASLPAGPATRRAPALA
jgi:glycosyltransferase involved in cell wall biosynthesis